MNKEFNSLNFLRGLSAFGVCFFHLTCTIEYFPDSSFIKIIGHYGHYGVDSFFVISGFVIPYSMYAKGYKIHNWVQFMIKRIIRIYPPYFINILFAIALAYLSTLYMKKEFSLDYFNLISHLGYLYSYFNLTPFNPVFWTLIVELQYYLLISLIFPFIISSNKYIRYCTLLSYFFIGMIIPEGRSIFNYSLIFIPGIAIFLFITKNIKRKEFIILIIVTLIPLYFHEVASFLTVIFTSTIILFTNIDFNFTNFLGKISYSFYLIHFPVGTRIIYLSKGIIENEMVRAGFIFVAIAITIAVSWIFFAIIEKPCLHWSSKINYHKKGLEESIIINS